MNGQRRIRLSLFTVPDLSIGVAPLTPQNSQFDRRRVKYLEGMVCYLNELFESLSSSYARADAIARLETLLLRLPNSELVQINPSARLPVREVASARDRIVFNHEHLKITFLDGFYRRPESPTIRVGRCSPIFAGVISSLSRGVSEDMLRDMCRTPDVDLTPAITRLRDLEIIENVDGNDPPPPARLGREDRLSWLGHACVLFQSSLASICVDPFLRPHIRWTEKERSSCFSDSFADCAFFEPYGPQLPQLSPAELPPLDAVFITHQDIDHFNLGVLMMLPEDVPIVVPDFNPDHPWELDLSAVIRNILGPKRNVIRLKHGETITIGDIRATAFPFFAEMPSSLGTLWNCYLFETNHAAVACAADSAITKDSVQFLINRLTGSKKPLVLCARSIHSGKTAAGHRDEMENFLNFTRLWAWYVPIWDLFQPVEQPGISENLLEVLSARTNLRFYLPYAMGSAPWYRINDINDPLSVPMANLSLGELRTLSGKLQAVTEHCTLFPGKFAEPVPLGPTPTAVHRLSSIHG